MSSDQDGRSATFTQFNGIVTTYTYDAASRLTGIANSLASFQFTLDANGNRTGSNETQPLSPTASNGVSAVYTYNTQKDRLLSYGPLSYSYDNEGQLVSSGGTCLTFDYNHRLVEIGSDTQFSYDGRGNRLTATRAGVTTRYIYDPWGNLMAEADSSNNIVRKYVYGRGLLALATSSARYCYHFNGTGSTVAITDMTGAVVNSYAYDPFGTVLNQQETIPQPFKYVGQYGVMAEPNGLYYMRARYYDPAVGRFISEDPLGFGGGDVNLYVYVKSNPVNWIDPPGLGRVSPVDLLEPAGPGGGPMGGFPPEEGVLGRGGGEALNAARLGAVEESAALAESLSAAARRAGQKVGPGCGGVYGTRVHSAFKAEVDALGDPYLFTERSYLNGELVDYGTPGSIRVDAGSGTPKNPTAIWDLKTGGAKLMPDRIQEIQSHLPGGGNVPVYELRP